MTVLKLNDKLLDVITTARSVVSQLDLDKALAITLKKALEITGARAGSIALFAPETGVMRVHAQKGFSRDGIPNLSWKVRRGGLTDHVLKSGTVMVITDQSFVNDPLVVQQGFRSLVCVPLLQASEPVGILCAGNLTKRRVSSRALQELEILGSFASIAIRHARMHEEVKQQAAIDTLTGLFNRRSFENLLSREFQRASRHQREFSLALVDVDDFKKFNDAYGHPAGDEALASLGEAIKQSIRSTDLAARYGWDEMAIILPETNLSKAFTLFATRVKCEIEDRFARLSAGRYALTVTIGIASYPEDGENAIDLILSADRALFAAKKEKHSRRIGCARVVPGAMLVKP